MSRKNKYIINYDSNHDVVWFDINYISNDSVKLFLDDVRWNNIKLIKSYDVPLETNSKEENEMPPSVLTSMEIALNHLKEYNNSTSVEKHIQYVLQWIKDQR